MTGPGEGRGRQQEQPTEPLSELIEAMNDRVGMNLTDADRLCFEQQHAHLRDDEVRRVALTNDHQQFKVFLEPKVETKVADRHRANDPLFQAFFDRPGFRELMLSWPTKTLSDGVRSGAAT